MSQQVGAMGPDGYCGPCGFKIKLTPEHAEWYVRQMDAAHGPGHSAYKCPDGNGWHVHSRDDDMRVTSGYNVPPPDPQERNRP